MSAERDDQIAQYEVAAELKAAVGARRELSSDLEDHVLEAFLARIEQRIDLRVDERVALAAPKRGIREGKDTTPGVAIVGASLALSIPLLAIAGGIAGTAGILAVMAMVVIINVLYLVDRWR